MRYNRFLMRANAKDMWFWQRVSAIALIILLVLHVFKFALFFPVHVAFAAFVCVHLYIGMIAITREYIKKPTLNTFLNMFYLVLFLVMFFAAFRIAEVTF
ncbi:MAG: hypothetical protein C0177_03725 [Fervidicoccus fontis]|nr:MAG: hypothetical protein C0177_03725 [Fervidicoccus fontis]HEM55746.1 hypothetical protein [Thermodesulfobium narugense]